MKNFFRSIVLKITLAVLCLFAFAAPVSAFTACNGTPTDNTNTNVNNVSIGSTYLFTFTDDSMAPTYKKGDVLRAKVAKNYNFQELRATTYAEDGTVIPGDIIVYWTVVNGKNVIQAHRIIAIYDAGDYLIFAVKGDANSEADPYTVRQEAIAGVYKVNK